MTGRDHHPGENLVDFNPHPRTEGDGQKAAKITPARYFNPHPRTEGDERLQVSVGAELQISTHTLARRVTQAENMDEAKRLEFQPTPSHGG